MSTIVQQEYVEQVSKLIQEKYREIHKNILRPEMSPMSQIIKNIAQQQEEISNNNVAHNKNLSNNSLVSTLVN
jgi:lipoate synthase